MARGPRGSLTTQRKAGARVVAAFMAHVERGVVMTPSVMQGPNADVPHEQGEGDAMARPMEEARGKRPKGVPHNATQGRGSSRGRPFQEVCVVVLGWSLIPRDRHDCGTPSCFEPRCP